MRAWLVVPLLLFSVSVPAQPDWSEGATINAEGRANPYEVPDWEWPAVTRAGRRHALEYPVDVSILIPDRPIRRFLAAEATDPLRLVLQRVAAGLNRISSFDQFEGWLGLHAYPENEGQGPYQIPPLDGGPSRRMGLSVVETELGSGFTISCAQCHSADLFGRKIIGLTNRFPRANGFFHTGLRAQSLVTPGLFRWATGATPGETLMFANAQNVLKFIGAKAPVQLGLDTSLAQVALSLAKRAPDGWATQIPGAPARPEVLSTFVADSKPAVWWNVKYKNRWLSDGSVVSGNPILTNLLWNEIGRGTDLHRLADWLQRKPGVIRELTTAVFGATAPRWTDFFHPGTLDLESAQRGEKVFLQSCARCHGVYEKDWARADAPTLRVRYRQKTPVIDVGTDPQRAQGMASLARLNDLEISKREGIRIVPQKGYVPPPLVGIWARWPYFHNNSAATLCDVLTRGDRRPVTYWARPANDPAEDFDFACNGYPRGRPAGAGSEKLYDTRRPGLGNRGHDEGIFLKNGEELLTTQDKKDLIQFLRTL